ncbi:MAG: anhydro-N-acetylmuramic acid kinase [Proteobacteria bacterium]|nr:anhydro-N-acetylmuramic acid kinase [Pseudomonadota bacterium]
MSKQKTVIGLMSGTSLDGIDAALVVTDGATVSRRGAFVHIPYGEDFRDQLKQALARAGSAGKKIGGKFFTGLEQELTGVHAYAVQECLQQNSMAASDVDLVGFHGQTVLHAPEAGITWQLGDGAMLARLVGIDVVSDFRSNDVKNGGQGAPLASLYHQALFQGMSKNYPVAVLNIGGVANVTWVSGDRLLAFDTGPGNALLDDWVSERTSQLFDEGGKLAAAGELDEEILSAWINHPYFSARPPKSLDRNAFPVENLKGLSIEDGAATLTAFTVGAIIKATAYFPSTAGTWIVTGGGRKNDFMMDQLAKILKVPVVPIENYGLDGDAIEAEAFAFLAVRSVMGLPLSLPSTTGVKEPMPGGVLVRGRN